MRGGMNVRRKPRQAAGGAIEISWEDKLGQFKQARARLLDISENGIKVGIPEAIEVRSLVNIRLTSYPIAGSASVKHCRRTGSVFVTGLEFTAGLQWNPPAR